MDGIRATPYQRPIAGSINDLVGGLLGYMRDPRRTQQLQGLAGLLESTGIPKTVERLAYGEPLTNAQMANVPLLRPETAEALLTLLPTAPAATKAAKATKGLPVGMSIKDVSQRSIYPQEEALRLAQQRAALPVDRGGLGLPANNTPEMRAQAMGFEPRGFHETQGSNIEAGLLSFDPRRVGAAASDEQTPYAMFIKPHGGRIGVARENEAQMPLYVKSNLSDENIMRAFSNRNELQNYLNQFPEIKQATQAVRDLDNKMAEYMNQQMIKADELYKQGKNAEADKIMDSMNRDSPMMKQFDERTNELAAIAKEKITKLFKDQQVGTVGLTNDEGAMGRSTITEMVLNPNENVRSRFAAFDPFRRTAAIAATMGVAAPDLLAAENPLTEEEIRYIRSLLD